ncbi:MAG: hypothetical protein Q7T44_15680 [Parvibaculum sp.]|nr:hypothetical protein [Parvibaculum sp.]
MTGARLRKYPFSSPFPNDPTQAGFPQKILKKTIADRSCDARFSAWKIGVGQGRIQGYF